MSFTLVRVKDAHTPEVAILGKKKITFILWYEIRYIIMCQNRTAENYYLMVLISSVVTVDLSLHAYPMFCKNVMYKLIVQSTNNAPTLTVNNGSLNLQ